MNFPFNIGSTALLILGKFPSTSMEFMLSSIISETVGLLSLIILLARANSSICSCKKYLVSLQCGLGIYQLRDKIHHLRFYELVNYKRDIGFSVGIFGVITKRKLHEVCNTFDTVNY